MFVDSFSGTDNQLRAWNTGSQVQFSTPYPKGPLFLSPSGNSKGSTEKLKDLSKLTGLVGSPSRLIPGLCGLPASTVTSTASEWAKEVVVQGRGEPPLRVSSVLEFSLPPYVKKKENNLTTTTQRNLDHFEKNTKKSDLCEI